MEVTYKVRGADGNEYGPATLQEIAQWHADGRISAETMMSRSDTGGWAAAGTFAELAIPVPAPAPLPSPALPGRAVPIAGPNPEFAAQLKNGASWFYWIAGLSLINSLSALGGADWGFVLGLGITQIFDAIAHEMAGGAKIFALVLDCLAAGVFIFFGVFAHKGHTWSFVVGMVLYALDGLLFLLAGDWLGLGFHVFVLYSLFRGFQACRELSGSS